MKNRTFIFPDAKRISDRTKRPAAVFDEIASTNTALIGAIKSGDFSPVIYTALSQSSGRGRLGRSFSSETGGIYFSFNLTLPISEAPMKAHLITPLAGVAVTDALNGLYGIGAELKWVNDITVGGKKLGGILSEAVTVGDKTHIIVGIGINAVNTDFPDTATSLSLIKDGSYDANEIISHTVNAFFTRYPNISAISSVYRTRLCHLGRKVTLHRFDGTPDECVTAVDVNEDCELTVRDGDGHEYSVSSGELSIIIEKN